MSKINKATFLLATDPVLMSEIRNYCKGSGMTVTSMLNLLIKSGWNDAKMNKLVVKLNPESTSLKLSQPTQKEVV